MKPLNEQGKVNLNFSHPVQSKKIEPLQFPVKTL